MTLSNYHDFIFPGWVGNILAPSKRRVKCTKFVSSLLKRYYKFPAPTNRLIQCTRYAVHTSFIGTFVHIPLERCFPPRRQSYLPSSKADTYISFVDDNSQILINNKDGLTLVFYWEGKLFIGHLNKASIAMFSRCHFQWDHGPVGVVRAKIDLHMGQYIGVISIGT